nr:kinesin-like protein KIN-13B [Ipomoea batatas]
MIYRVKSLSKGNNSKKDTSSSTLNLRESTVLPMSVVAPSASTYEDDTGDSWPEQTEKDDYDDFYEQEKPISKRNVKVEAFSISNPEEKMRRGNDQTKWKEPPRTEPKINDNDDLNSLLKEEEDLVNAHRRQVEETMDIVREEMNLLVEADQPGNQLDSYISRLNSILSQKAAAIVQLQGRLAQFQRRLREHNVLASSGH